MQQKMNKVYTLDIHIYICKISSHWAGDTVTDEVEDREAFRSIFLRFKLLGAFTAESSATEMASPASTWTEAFSGADNTTRQEANKDL